MSERLEEQPRIGDIYVIPSYRLAYLVYRDAPKPLKLGFIKRRPVDWKAWWLSPGRFAA